MCYSRCEQECNCGCQCLVIWSTRGESLVFHLAAAATVCWALGSYNWDKEVSPHNGAGAKHGKSTIGCSTLEKKEQKAKYEYK